MVTGSISNTKINLVKKTREDTLPIQAINNLVEIERYSNVKKLLCITAWILRFIKNVCLKKDNRNLHTYTSSEERNVALSMWMKVNQRVLLKSTKYEDIKSSLNLIKNNDGIFRAYGRIQLANLPEETRKPIMLERSHRLAERILLDCKTQWCA